MKKLQIHILTKNNSSVISDTISSFYNFGEILICDLGSTDNTLELCKEFKIVKPNKTDRSWIRNSIVNESPLDWHMFVYPGEKIISGSNLIDNITDIKAYSVFIRQSNIITKQARIWNKKLGLKFVNPIYEYLDASESTKIDCILESNNNENINEDDIDRWISENIINPVPYYYKSFYLLQNNKKQEFINLSDKYLFYEKKQSPSWILTKYYRSMVYLDFKSNKAITEIKDCLSTKPYMAEFWCLAGDIYFKSNDFYKAKEMYEMAIIQGKKRDIKDDMPIEPAKYKDYPENRIEVCSMAILETKSYYITNN